MTSFIKSAITPKDDASEGSPLLTSTIKSQYNTTSGSEDATEDIVSEDTYDQRDHLLHGRPLAADDPVLRRLKTATALCCTFMIIEVVGGLLAGSLAVLSDAAHLMADLASFAVAIVAAYLAARPSTDKHTYGLKRTESLAALFSMTCLAFISVGLGLEALRRVYGILQKKEAEDVDGKLMSMIAAIGVLVNLALAAVLGEHHTHLPGGSHRHDHSHDHGTCGGHHGPTTATTNPQLDLFGDAENPVPLKTISSVQQRNVNLRAAYLHVMADLAQSVAVMIAGLIIWWKPHWKIVDPIATILFCILVFYSTLGVIRASVCVLLEEVPSDVSWQRIHDSMLLLPGVTDVHDLHIWSISHGVTALSVHVRTTSTRVNTKQVLRTLATVCKANGVQHTTIQVQPHCVIDNGCVTCGMNDESQTCVIGGHCCKSDSYEVTTYCRRTSSKTNLDSYDDSSTPAETRSQANDGCAGGGCCT